MELIYDFERAVNRILDSISQYNVLLHKLRFLHVTLHKVIFQVKQQN